MIQRRPGWLTSKVGQELIMMSVQNGVYIGLNEVGARVWEMIASPKDISELCGALAEVAEKVQRQPIAPLKVIDRDHQRHLGR